jgi:hypothetical protein
MKRHDVFVYSLDAVCVMSVQTFTVRVYNVINRRMEIEPMWR